MFGLVLELKHVWVRVRVRGRGRFGEHERFRAIKGDWTGLEPGMLRLSEP